MIWRDALEIAAHNLLKLKLRSVLTTAGVVIAVAAFVAMLSFGAGNQRLISEQYEKFGLLFTIQVFPREPKPDSMAPPALDQSAVEKFAGLPGVRRAYPFDPITVDITTDDTTLPSRAQALPASALSARRFSQWTAGTAFESDSAREVLVSAELADDLGWPIPEDAIGQRLVLTVRLATLDSALLRVFSDPDGTLRARWRRLRWDSLRIEQYLRRTVRTEIAAGLKRFSGGLTQARRIVTDTLIVRGIFDPGHMHRHTLEPLIIPEGTARRLTRGGLSDNPLEIFTSLSQGRVPAGWDETDLRSYPRVTIELDPATPFETVRDTLEAMGFQTFSYAEQFAEIRRFFFYFDLALGLVGLIALVTASLGIANTLIMATVERRREIGVLKALGAQDNDIRVLFFVESGTIGTVGALVGLAAGWAVSRLGSTVAQAIMVRQGVDPVDFFAVPLWLGAAAMAVGVTVSVAAGYYPAVRAARTNPVDALRAD